MWNDLGRFFEELSPGSFDGKAAKTLCSRTIHFLRFIDKYELRKLFLPDDKVVTTLPSIPAFEYPLWNDLRRFAQELSSGSIDGKVAKNLVLSDNSCLKVHR